MKKILVILLVLSTLSCEQKESNLIPFLERDNALQREQLTNEFKQFGMFAVLNPALKEMLGETKKLDSEIKALINGIENFNGLDSTHENSFRKIVDYMSSKIKKSDIDYLEYLNGHLFHLMDNKESFRTKEFRLHFVNTMIESEIFFIKYVTLFANRMDFDAITPLIESIDSKNYKLTLAAYDRGAVGKFYLGIYDSIVHENYTSFQPLSNNAGIEFQNGFAQFELEGPDLIGLVEYYFKDETKPFYYPVKRTKNKR